MMNAKQRVLLTMIIAAFIVPIAMLLFKLIQESPENDLDDYLKRIARVQNAALIDWDFESFDTPSRRDFYTPIERLTIGLLESAELRKCDLLEMVYLHNDALGKVQDEFRNLDYQVAVLSGLNVCIDQGQLSSALTNKLKGIYQKKWQQLPLHISNTLLYSTASHKQRFSEQWLSLDSVANRQFYKDYSTTLVQLINGYEKQDLPLNFTLTSFQETLEKQRAMGELFYTLHYTHQWLTRINQQLISHNANVICDQNGHSEQLKIMLNIFSEVYVKRLQPYFAHISDHYFAIAPLLKIYDHPFVTQQTSYLLESQYALFKKQLREHVIYWTQLRERCGLSMQQLIGDKQ
jgi:hypothetical protein